MREYHERVLLDDQVCIRKTLVELVAVLIDDATKGDGNVAQRDDDIATDTRVSRGLEDLEQEAMVLVTEL